MIYLTCSLMVMAQRVEYIGLYILHAWATTCPKNVHPDFGMCNQATSYQLQLDCSTPSNVHRSFIKNDCNDKCLGNDWTVQGGSV